jgi:hypothetical protein
MGYRYTSLNPKQQVKMNTERVKVLKVTGEQVKQIVVESEVLLDTIQIDHIGAELQEVTDQFLAGRIIKQGIAQIQIFYVKPDYTLNYLIEEIPFSLSFEIPDFIPDSFADVKTHLLDLNSNYDLLPALANEPAILQLKAVGHLLVKTAVWTEIDVVTRVDLYPKQL